MYLSIDFLSMSVTDLLSKFCLYPIPFNTPAAYSISASDKRVAGFDL